MSKQSEIQVIMSRIRPYLKRKGLIKKDGGLNLREGSEYDAEVLIESIAQYIHKNAPRH